ncbi:MAG: MOSC domain-containing protein [Burkholderiaceae bacterium]
MNASVVAVSASPIHGFSKQRVHKIRLLAGLGVEGDAHCGVTVRHRSRVAQDPTQPNLRQVHLIQEALFDALRQQSSEVEPGQLGGNITTRHLDLLALPAGAELHIGRCAVVRLTGLRNPCEQLNRFQDGLMAALISRSPDGSLVRKAGVMGVVLAGGVVTPGDPIAVKLPAGPFRALDRV